MNVSQLAMIGGGGGGMAVILLFLLPILAIAPLATLVVAVSYWFEGNRAKAWRFGIPAGLVFAAEILYIMARSIA